MPEKPFTWTDRNTACIATFNILEGDDQLNQFDRMFLKFDTAGETRLSSLPYFGHNLDGDDLEGRSRQMARKFLKFLVMLFTNRKERDEDDVESIRRAFFEQFRSEKATFRTLAEQADRFLKFKGET
jgi:acetyl/propionyl-CoA carboxylase alpha subunit